MKSVLFWMLRHLVITAGFIFATGIPQTFHEVSGSKIKDPMMTFTAEEFKTLEITPRNQRVYLDSLIALQRMNAQQHAYSPFLYFHDLKQMRMYEEYYKDSLQNNRRGMDYFSFTFQVNELCNIQTGYLRNNSAVSNEDLDRARDYWFPAGKESRDHAAKVTTTDVIAWLLGWLLRVYLRGLLFACMLFFIWKFKMKQEFDEETRYYSVKPEIRLGFAPLSFLVSLVFWPIILGIDIYSRFNKVLKKAEIVSRRSTLLALFSKQERKLLEAGRNMSLPEFRIYLDTIGITRKHSFAAAVMMTFVITLVPKSMFPSTEHHHEQQTIITHIDYGGDHTDHETNSTTLWDAIVPLLNHLSLQITLLDISYVPIRSGKTLAGFLADIGGVPKVSINFARN